MLNIAKLITPEVIKSVFKDMKLELNHDERFDGDGGRIHEVTAVLSYRDSPVLTSNRITVRAPYP
jgi:hypothetical protein